VLAHVEARQMSAKRPRHPGDGPEEGARTARLPGSDEVVAQSHEGSGGVEAWVTTNLTEQQLQPGAERLAVIDRPLRVVVRTADM
jgi:hypothetical protein